MSRLRKILRRLYWSILALVILSWLVSHRIPTHWCCADAEGFAQLSFESGHLSVTSLDPWTGPDDRRADNKTSGLSFYLRRIGVSAKGKR